jgi:hypothetical protein
LFRLKKIKKNKESPPEKKSVSHKDNKVEDNNQDENDDNISWTSDNQEIQLSCCYCSRPAHSHMIFCDECLEFYHMECVGLSKDSEPDDKYFCPFCKRDINYLKNHYDKLPQMAFFTKAVSSYYSVLLFNKKLF